MRTYLPSEKVNYWTHHIGMLVWIPVTLLLLAVSLGLVKLGSWFEVQGLYLPFWGISYSFSPQAAPVPRWDLAVVSLVYGLSVIFLFYCSSSYHKHKKQENERSLRRTLDHFAIFVMIAGSYTPTVYIWFQEPVKWITLIFQWTVTVVGLFFKVFVKNPPRWLGVVLYLMMGWVAVLAIVPLYQLMIFPVFFDMIWGGLWYSAGAVMYALKKPVLKPGVFGFHELFHVFILGGAVTHFSMVLRSLVYAVR